jgi:alanine racemase
MKFSELISITNGQAIDEWRERPVTHLLIDSRKAIFHEGSVFFAIGGAHHNGHHFNNTLYESAIRQFVVEEAFDVKKYKVPNFLKLN